MFQSSRGWSIGTNIFGLRYAASFIVYVETAAAAAAIAAAATEGHVLQDFITEIAVAIILVESAAGVAVVAMVAVVAVVAVVEAMVAVAVAVLTTAVQVAWTCSSSHRRYWHILVHHCGVVWWHCGMANTSAIHTHTLKPQRALNTWPLSRQTGWRHCVRSVWLVACWYAKKPQTMWFCVEGLWPSCVTGQFADFA
jgi:hypothetical protein